MPMSHLTPSLGVIPREYVDEPYTVKTRVNGLRDSEDGIRDAQESRGLGDVYKRQV